MRHTKVFYWKTDQKVGSLLEPGTLSSVSHCVLVSQWECGEKKHLYIEIKFSIIQSSMNVGCSVKIVVKLTTVTYSTCQTFQRIHLC